jgi:hypothetical protein
MSEFRPHTGLSACGCFQCNLIRCGAVDADWDGWNDVEFAGWARLLLFRLTCMEPPVRPEPRRQWKGTLDWFRVLGLALNFDDAVEGDDESA